MHTQASSVKASTLPWVLTQSVQSWGGLYYSGHGKDTVSRQMEELRAEIGMTPFAMHNY